LLERKKSKRKNSPWIRPDVDKHAGKKATWRLRRIRRQENHSAVCGYVWPANGLCQVQGRYHGRAGQGDPLDRVYARRLLIVITCEEDKRQFTVLTVQPRVPTGKYALEELPAGMLDMSGSFVGAAAKELQEETGIIVNEKGLIDLTEKAFKGTAYNHVYPSAGGCDEILRLFLHQTTMSRARLIELEGKCTGVLEEGENIKLKVISLHELWREAPDVKALSALCIHENLLARRELPIDYITGL